MQIVRKLFVYNLDLVKRPAPAIVRVIRPPFTRLSEYYIRGDWTFDDQLWRLRGPVDT